MASQVRHYLDHNATTPPDRRVAEAVYAALMGGAGNPSSVHREGREARSRVEAARSQVAGLMNASPFDIVFTSGGTEADLLGMLGLAGSFSAGPVSVITTEVDHPAVWGTAQALAQGRLASVACEHKVVKVDGSARVDPASLRAAIDGPAVVALSLANHEFGTVQEVKALCAVAHECDALVHVDAVQAAGKLPLDVADLGADTVALSAHKFYGPKGVGALWIKSGFELAPLAEAGHQERDRRPGTENTAGIIGMGVAAELVSTEGLDLAPQIAELTRALEVGLSEIPDAVIHARDARRVGNTICVSFPGAPGDAVVQGLDLAGIAVSTGAACTSGSVEPSKVVLGTGHGEAMARAAVRFSTGRGNLECDIEEVVLRTREVVARVRQFHRS